MLFTLAALNNVVVIVLLVLLLAFAGFLNYTGKAKGAIYAVLAYLAIGLLFLSGAISL